MVVVRSLSDQQFVRKSLYLAQEFCKNNPHFGLRPQTLSDPLPLPCSDEIFSLQLITCVRCWETDGEREHLYWERIRSFFHRISYLEAIFVPKNKKIVSCLIGEFCKNNLILGFSPIPPLTPSFCPPRWNLILIPKYPWPSHKKKVQLVKKYGTFCGYSGLVFWVMLQNILKVALWWAVSKIMHTYSP